ncbi:heme exporter protein CcmD [Larsenimonas rhizosphaerae]|uniref:Heme exporter protein D n=1 Tax=Larsenimonas rhizosphaerae TaxID=2944682 RepID=A0AA41ZJ45_9GAMM|nr:heme exporter protein CcmD [Larsenimonas rhizosphaerae]MCM2130002.1 heme exporter protein CcmD [Larsenimonas rhizosphaerae]MCX2522701.1 heme exporter protein CcmD [Larsenimonas rhizosphaerae]
MAFDSLNAFMSMNGYGLYVWTAWGVITGLCVAQVIMARLEHRRIVQRIRRQIRREQQL